VTRRRRRTAPKKVPATRRAYRTTDGRFISRAAYLSLPRAETQSDTIRVVLPKRKKVRRRRRC